MLYMNYYICNNWYVCQERYRYLENKEIHCELGSLKKKEFRMEFALCLEGCVGVREMRMFHIYSLLRFHGLLLLILSL